MRRIVFGISLLFVLSPLIAAPEEGVDMTLPRSTDRYIPGLISGEEAQVDRRMEVTEHETSAPTEATQPKPEKKPEPSDEGDGFFVNLFKDQTTINLLILSVMLGIFFLYQLRYRGSRR